MAPTDDDSGHGLAHTIDVAGRYSWRLVGIGLAGWALIVVLSRVRIVLLALLAAALLTVVLAGPARFLRSHGWRPGLAALVVMVGFLALLGAVGAVLVPPVGDQFSDLGPVVADGIDDVERWLVRDSPFDVSAQRLDELRQEAGERLRRLFTSGAVVAGAVVVFEVLAGLLMAMVTTAFFLKDGERFQHWALARVPAPRREEAKALAAAGWRGLGGYLRGAALLGVVEGAVIGVALFLVGAGLALPVALLTFVAAFVPFVGAIVAGTVAVLVALVTAGGPAALIVAGVAIAVQNLDNDLLAPIVYGKALQIHPLVILLSVAAAASLAGAVGVFAAVPVVAVVSSVIAERSKLAEKGGPPADSEH